MSALFTSNQRNSGGHRPPLQNNVMTRRVLTFTVLTWFAALNAVGQGWKTPRTPDGQPDLQGIWTNATLTPLQRPADLGDKQFFTAQEAAAYEKQRIQQT